MILKFRSLVPDWGEEFVQWNNTRLSHCKRIAFMWLDKLIFLALHWRGTNQLKWDSDRSWPTR